MILRTAASLALLALAGCSLLEPSKPRLVLLVVVDQLAYNYIERFDALYDGGFRRLLDEGASFSNAKYRHGATVTAAGHATISSGRFPSHTGMVNNAWRGYDPTEKFTNINCVADFTEGLRPIGGEGAVASPKNMLADSIGDLLKRQHQGSKVVSISWKDRAANLMAGREADAAFWFSSACGCFITSSHFVDETPEWLAAFNSSDTVRQYAGKDWERSKSPSLYEQHARSDAFPGEPAQDAIFPHTMPVTPELYGQMNRSPFSDAVLLEGAKAMLDAYELGQDDEPDILAIGFSATDYVGHRWGPYSQEAMDNHLRLDALLGELFELIDERVGLDQTVVALSADHGATELVEFREGWKRVSPRELAAIVNEAVAKEIPALEKAAAAVSAGSVYLNLPAIEDADANVTQVAAIAKQALLAHSEVAEVFTHDDLKSPDGSGEYWQLLRNSFFERRSPHLLVRLKDGRFPGNGAGHGSPYERDRHVPLILMGKGVQPGRYASEAGPDEIAPTLARLLGFEMSLEPGSRVLDEALR